MRLFGSHKERDAARAAYAEIDAALAGGPAQAHAVAARLRAEPLGGDLSPEERQQLADDALRHYVESAVRDDHLDEAEEGAFVDLAGALGIGQGDLEGRLRDVLGRLVLARANDGRLATVPQPRLIAHPGEVVYLEGAATLLKDVALREYRGGYSGVSVRVAKGVRVSTGGVRGHSVVVGHELQAEDRGTLSVSSLRAVYLGAEKTIEVPYAKLVGVDVFSDAVRLHASNRQRAPLFGVENGPMFAAVVNAAVQRQLGG